MKQHGRGGERDFLLEGRCDETRRNQTAAAAATTTKCVLRLGGMASQRGWPMQWGGFCHFRPQHCHPPFCPPAVSSVSKREGSGSEAEAPFAIYPEDLVVISCVVLCPSAVLTSLPGSSTVTYLFSIVRVLSSSSKWLRLLCATWKWVPDITASCSWVTLCTESQAALIILVLLPPTPFRCHPHEQLSHHACLVPFRGDPPSSLLWLSQLDFPGLSGGLPITSCMSLHME